MCVNERKSLNTQKIQPFGIRSWGCLGGVNETNFRCYLWLIESGLYLSVQ